MALSFDDDINSLLRSHLEVMLDLAVRVRALRLAENITQKALAGRVGVAVGTIKRFEKTGEIQLNHLLRIALVFGRLDEFDRLFCPPDKPASLFHMKEPKNRQRARNQ